MSDVNSLDSSIEELLSICSRSIVVPDIITMEANKIMSIMNDHNLEQKYIVEGCETLSLLASSFIRSGYDSFLINYAREEQSNHWVSSFANKNELIKYCEICVEYGDESLRKMKNSIMTQLEIENHMTKDEIYNLNIKNYEFKKRTLLETNNNETKNPSNETFQNPITVQEQITNYIILSLLVNSLKEFFKKYYKGLN